MLGIGLSMGLTCAASIFNLSPFATASFFAPLTSSLTLSKGTGSATFTRATTATHVQPDGNTVLCKTGEARFSGARRVENLFTGTSDYSNWTIQAGITITQTAGIAPDGTNTLTRVDKTGTSQHYRALNLPILNNTVSHVFKAGTGCVAAYIGAYLTTASAYFDLVTGTVTAQNGCTGNVVSLGGGFFRCSITTATAIVEHHIGALDAIYTGTSTAGYTVATGPCSFYIWHPQYENVTGQSVQTASEYVSSTENSTGALGVKYFETDYTGNPIPQATLKGYLAEGAATNLCLYSNDLTNPLWLKTGSTSAAPVVTANTAIVTPIGVGCSQVSYPAVSAALAYSVVYQLLTAQTAGIWLKGNAGGEVIYLMETAIGVVYTKTTCSLTTNWQYFSLTKTASGSSYWQLGIDLRDGTQTAKASQTIFVSGCQIEASPFATSYIPTTSTAVTRNADVLTYPMAGNAAANLGSMALEWTPEATLADTANADGNGYCILLDLGVANYALGRISNKSVLWRNGAPLVANLMWSPTTGGVTYKEAGVFGNIACKTALSGVISASSAVQSGSTIGATISVGKYGGGNMFSATGNIRNVRLWTTQLTDAQLVTITS